MIAALLDRGRLRLADAWRLGGERLPRTLNHFRLRFELLPARAGIPNALRTQRSGGEQMGLVEAAELRPGGAARRGVTRCGSRPSSKPACAR